MSKFTFTVQTFLFAAMTFLAHASQQTVNSVSEFESDLTGRVSMNGTIISSACDIDTGDGYQAIAMPTATRAHIKRSGEGFSQEFSILLKNCSLDSENDATAGQTVNIIFDGDEDAGMFRVNGHARGVALELLDRNGTVIRPGKAMPLQQTYMIDNRLEYRFKIKNNMRDIVVGDYNAIIRYRIEYF